jgi:hypothetical protein
MLRKGWCFSGGSLGSSLGVAVPASAWLGSAHVRYLGPREVPGGGCLPVSFFSRVKIGQFTWRTRGLPGLIISLPERGRG